MLKPAEENVQSVLIKILRKIDVLLRNFKQNKNVIMRGMEIPVNGLQIFGNHAQQIVANGIVKIVK